MFAPSFCGGSHSYFQDEGKSNQVKRRPTKMVFPTSNIHSKGKADSTRRCSQAVPHPSTNQALRRLTSEVGRDPVYSTRYGRQREMYPEMSHIFMKRPWLPKVRIVCVTAWNHWLRSMHAMCKLRPRHQIFAMQSME